MLSPDHHLFVTANQIATAALVQVLRAAEAQPADNSPEVHAAPRTKCWSLVGNGSAADHNLRASQAAGWRLRNLKGQPVHGMVQRLYKFVYITHTPNAPVKFGGITCSHHERVRIFHLRGQEMSLGRARVEIDGRPAVTPEGARYMSGYRKKQGALFDSTDFVIPRSSRTSHTVTVIALNETDNPYRGGFGFALNAIVCVPS